MEVSLNSSQAKGVATKSLNIEALAWSRPDVAKAGRDAKHLDRIPTDLRGRD